MYGVGCPGHEEAVHSSALGWSFNVVESVDPNVCTDLCCESFMGHSSSPLCMMELSLTTNASVCLMSSSHVPDEDFDSIVV